MQAFIKTNILTKFLDNRTEKSIFSCSQNVFNPTTEKFHNQPHVIPCLHILRICTRLQVCCVVKSKWSVYVCHYLSVKILSTTIFFSQTNCCCTYSERESRSNVSVFVILSPLYQVPKFVSCFQIL